MDLKILVWNSRGLNGTKIQDIKNQFSTNKIQVALIQETLHYELPDEFLTLFPAADFSFYHCQHGQKITSIVKMSALPTSTKVNFTDVSVLDSSLGHLVTFSGTLDPACGSDSYSILHLYQPPSVDCIHENIFGLFDKVDLIVGDCNVYTLRSEFGRDEQVANFLCNDGLLLSTGNSYHTTFAEVSASCGPDLIMQSLISPFVGDFQYGTLFSDHFSMIYTAFSVFTAPQTDQNHASPQPSPTVMYDYDLITPDIMFKEYEQLPVKPTFSDFLCIWKGWLKLCRKVKFIKRQKHDLASKISRLSSQQETDEWWSSWLDEANSINNLGCTFKLINFLKSLKDNSNNSIGPSLSSITPKDELEAFEDLQAKISQFSTVKRSKLKQFCRAKKWWLRILARNQFEFFTLSNLKDALKKINTKSVGKDLIPCSFFPTEDKHLQKFLIAANDLIFSNSPLPKEFLQTRTTFIPKQNSAKLRGLSIASRSSCLIELLISQRFMALINRSPTFSNRYGFLKGRSVDNVISSLVEKVWKNFENSKKQAIVSFDLSGAYDVVSYFHLLIKIKKAIQAVGEYGKFAFIFGFTLRWIFNRSTVFMGLTAYFQRGLPQGSPLSCFCFVIFFDFNLQPGDVENADVDSSFYADDSDHLCASNSWAGVESASEIIYLKFSEWCLKNGQSINDSKSVILFIRRKTPVNPNFQLQNAIKSQFRCLGIIIDKDFNFCAHVNYLKKWLKQRAAVFKKLRYELGIDPHVLLRALLSFRNKCLFGSWWILQCSDSNLHSLNTSFTQCLKAACGFSKLVPSDEVHAYAGIPSLLEYLPYWFGSRVLGLNLHGHEDIFSLHDKLKSQLFEKVPEVSYNFRHSTSLSRLEHFVSNDDYFPVSVDKWKTKCKPIIERGEYLIGRMGPYAYKNSLKRQFLPKIIDKKINIGIGVKQLNEFYYDLRVT